MSQTQIMLVENDPALAAIAREGLEALGYEVLGPYAAAEQALEKLPELKPDLVLMDITLDGAMDGIQAAEVIHRDFGLPVVYASALDDKPTLDRAAKAEPFGYIVKPYQLKDLRAAIEMALYKRQRDRERQEILEKTVGGSINMLSEIASVVAPESFGRSQKLKDYTLTLAVALNIRMTWELEVGALLSQIGYVMIPPSVLQKHRSGIPLATMERNMIEHSPEYGSELLRRIPRLETVADIVLYQNKNFDGSGFPDDDVSGLDIPLGARMLRVLGDFVELEAAKLTKARIIDQLSQAAGRYDPELLRQAIVNVIDAPPKGARAVKLDELTAGQTLKAAVETKDGTLLVAAETQITFVILKRLQNFAQVSGIKEPIYVGGKANGND